MLRLFSGSARRDEDYTHVEGVLNFAASELEKTIKVPVLDDLRCVTSTSIYSFHGSHECLGLSEFLGESIILDVFV